VGGRDQECAAGESGSEEHHVRYVDPECYG
jgi:hypothetical protein